jgi:hypothetical protein
VICVLFGACPDSNRDVLCGKIAFSLLFRRKNIMVAEIPPCLSLSRQGLNYCLIPSSIIYSLREIVHKRDVSSTIILSLRDIYKVMDNKKLQQDFKYFFKRLKKLLKKPLKKLLKK